MKNVCAFWLSVPGNVEFVDVLPRAVKCLTAGHRRFCGLTAAPDSVYSLQDELCFHVDTLVTVAANMPVLGGAQTPRDTEETAQPHPTFIQVSYFSILVSVQHAPLCPWANPPQ